MKRKAGLIIFTFLFAVLCLTLTGCKTIFKEGINFETVYDYVSKSGYTGTLEELTLAFETDSAYETVIEKGYVGTETDWLVTLIGAKKTSNTNVYIGKNGNWFIGDIDMGISANGKDGQKGDQGETGNGIAKIEKTSSDGNVDTYTITFTDGTTMSFNVTNGKDGEQGETGNCIAKFEKTSSDGNIDTYTITFTDGTMMSFNVTNGKDGQNGGQGETGNGIAKIEKTSSNRNVDTYTITFTDGTTMSFNVTNGKDGKDGKDGQDGQKGDQGETGNGIAKIEKTSSDGNVDTYTITFTDGTTMSFNVTNGEVRKDGPDETGNGIAKIEKTSSDGNVDTYTITFTDGTTMSFNVTNGKDGQDGKDGEQGETGNGIAKIDKTSSDGNVDTYTITFTDGTTMSFNVTNGKDGDQGETGNGIAKIEKTSSDGNVDTYTITFTDGTLISFNVTNGKDGQNGGQGETGNGIAKIEKTSSDGNVDTYTITFTDGTTMSFNLTNGEDGQDGKDGQDGQKGDQGEKGDKGDQGEAGLSAYEIYKIIYPEYIGTEEEWIKDLVSGLPSKVYYTVTFDSQGGSNIDEQRIEVGYKVTRPVQPVKAAYKFIKWTYLGEDWSFIGYSVTENMVLVAQWETIEYTVDFDSNLGSIVEDKYTVTFDDEITLPEPQRVGYTFEGWYYNDIKVENGFWRIPENVTLVAKWTVNTYTVSFETNVEGLTFEDIELVYEQDTLVLPTPERIGYTFEGWYYNDTKVESGLWNTLYNITLVARWTGNTYTVSYETNVEGLTVDNIELTYEQDTLVLPTVERAGYIFKGWLLNGVDASELNNKVWKRNENITLTAQWEAIKYTVDFDSNLGSIVENEYTLTFDNEITLPETQRVGYTFEGWYYNGIKVENGFWRIPESVTLVARWTANTYTVTFKTNVEGLSFDNIELTYEQDTLELENLELTGYTFEGWYYNDTKVESGLWNTPNNVTLVAKWTANTYTVTFDSNGGSAVEPLSVTYGENFTLPTSERTDYTFAGWYMGDNQIVNGIWSIANDVTLVVLWEDIFTYTVSGNGVIITGYRASDSNVIIPTYYYGYPVREIGEYAFADNKIITSLYVPGSVKEIRPYAFNNCTNLVSVKLSKGLLYIGNDAFKGCSITSIIFPSTLLSIADRAFQGCKLSSVIFPDSLSDIQIGPNMLCGNNLTIYVESASKPYTWYSDPYSTDIEYVVVCNTILSEDKTYVVAVDKKEDWLTSSTTVDYGNNPIREGYTFGGWYVDRFFQSYRYDNILQTPTTKVYAKWIEN